MNQKILLVDDDLHVLRGYQRRLYEHFEIITAQGGPEGLATLESTGPFAVVVADMRMPVLDGVQFLSRVKSVAPDTVRMMLTGYADVQTAIDAVNRGNIFRFLTKPCSMELFYEALQAGVRQYQLVSAERELLEDTLNGSIKVLIEVLSLANPAAFSRANRVTKLVGQLAATYQADNGWQYKLAAMLSQLGCITLPPGVLEKINAQIPLTPEEQKMYQAHPAVGGKLLAHIPRLKLIAEMITWQHRPAAQPLSPQDLTSEENIILFGSQLLKLALDFDELLSYEPSPVDALAVLHRRPDTYNPLLLSALDDIGLEFGDMGQDTVPQKALNVKELQTGMTIRRDVWAKNGILLVQKGQEITLPVLMRLRNFAEGTGVEEPIFVSQPANS